MKRILLIMSLATLFLPGLVSAQEQKIATEVSHPTVYASCVNLKKNMNYRTRDAGTSGEVSILQKFLKTKGYLDSESTGFFGSATLSAVKKFQSASNIWSTGFVGPLTRAGIKASSCLSVVVAPDAPTSATSTTPEVSSASSTLSLSQKETKSIFGASRLRIPQINVDALIEDVGLTPEGAMDSPRGPNEAGWYKLGPKPGESGSAVIDGHSGWKNGIPAVFDNLHKLSKGDKIYVEDEKGSVVTFVVREIRKYNPTADASDVFWSADDNAHLNLITCGGTWDKISRSSSERLIVFADKL